MSANLHSPPRVTRAQAAKMMNVSVRSVATASRILRLGIPELCRAIEDGSMSLNKAAKIVDLPQSEQLQAMTHGLPPKPFDWGDGVADLRKLFDRTAKKWPANERKELVHFWKQVANEASRNESWLEGDA